MIEAWPRSKNKNSKKVDEVAIAEKRLSYSYSKG